LLFNRVATAKNVVPPSFQTPAERENSLDALPHAYSLKTGSIPKYFEAMLTLPVPEVFDVAFLVSIGFRYAIDRALIDILKELRFITAQGKPTPRYFAFHDGATPHTVLQDGIRDAYGRLLERDPEARAKSDKQIFETLRHLYAGRKPDMMVIGIAKTFAALCSLARELERNPPQRPANEVAATAPAAAETSGPVAPETAATESAGAMPSPAADALPAQPEPVPASAADTAADRSFLVTEEPTPLNQALPQARVSPETPTRQPAKQAGNTPEATTASDVFPLVLEEDEASGANATAETAAPSLAPDRELKASAPDAATTPAPFLLVLEESEALPALTRQEPMASMQIEHAPETTAASDAFPLVLEEVAVPAPLEQPAAQTEDAPDAAAPPDAFALVLEESDVPAPQEQSAAQAGNTPDAPATPNAFPLILEKNATSAGDGMAETAAPSSPEPDQAHEACAPEPSPAQTPPVAARQALAEIPDAPAADTLPPNDAAAGTSRTPDAVPPASESPGRPPEAPPQTCAASIRLVRPDAATAEGQAPAAPCTVQFVLPHSDDPAVYDMIFASFNRHLLHPKK
jgi:hypothetical protein